MDHCLLSMFRNNVFFLIYLWYLLIISSRVINLICLASSVRWGWLRNCFHIVLDNVNTILCEKECNKLLTSCLYHKNLTSVIFFFVTQSILAILLSLTRNRIQKILMVYCSGILLRADNFIFYKCLTHISYSRGGLCMNKSVISYFSKFEHNNSLILQCGYIYYRLF